MAAVDRHKAAPRLLPVFSGHSTDGGSIQSEVQAYWAGG